MDKLNRTYLLTIETRDGGVITITPPFTLEFDIVRKNFGYGNQGQFRIYNLNTNNRNNIRFDQFDMGTFREITLQAGYTGGYDKTIQKGQLTTVFKGNLSRAYSARQGVDFITTIEAYDIGLASVNSVTNLVVPLGTAFSTVIRNLMEDLIPYGISPGIIGPSYSGSLLRGNTYSGSTVDLLNELTGKGFFVDNGIAHALGDSEAYIGTLPTIDSSSGLLGTPFLENTFLSFDIIFEPRLMVGQQIFLKSVTASDNISDRQYKVTGLHHRGVISESVCGNAVTTLSCLYGPLGLNIVGTS